MEASLALDREQAVKVVKQAQWLSEKLREIESPLSVLPFGERSGRWETPNADAEGTAPPAQLAWSAWVESPPTASG